MLELIAENAALRMLLLGLLFVLVVAGAYFAAQLATARQLAQYIDQLPADIGESKS